MKIFSRLRQKVWEFSKTTIKCLVVFFVKTCNNKHVTRQSDQRKQSRQTKSACDAIHTHFDRELSHIHRARYHISTDRRACAHTQTTPITIRQREGGTQYTDFKGMHSFNDTQVPQKNGYVNVHLCSFSRTDGFCIGTYITFLQIVIIYCTIIRLAIIAFVKSLILT